MTTKPPRAKKIGGSYQADGVIVSTFETTGGKTRHVFEFDQPAGMLHIFGPEQVEIATPVLDRAPVIAARPDCGACPGDGTICPTECRVKAESPPIADHQAAGSVEAERAAFEALRLAEDALLNSAPHVKHFPQQNRHAKALESVRAALAGHAVRAAGTPRLWTVWHEGKSVSAETLTACFAAARKLRTPEEQAVAAANLAAGIAAMQAEEEAERAALDSRAHPVAAGELPPIQGSVRHNQRFCALAVRYALAYGASVGSEDAGAEFKALTDFVDAYGQQCADSRPVAAGELPKTWEERMQESGRRESEWLALELMQAEIKEWRAYGQQCADSRPAGGATLDHLMQLADSYASLTGTNRDRAALHTALAAILAASVAQPGAPVPAQGEPDTAPGDSHGR